MQKAQCLMMALLAQGRMYILIWGGHCALQLTSVRGHQERLSHGAAGGTASYPLTSEPRVPQGWLHQLLWLPGTTGISSIPQPSPLPAPTPLGQEASQSDLGCSSCVLRHWTRPIPWGWS